jgi:hypothetical protein
LANRGGFFSNKSEAETENDEKDATVKVRKRQDTTDGANIHDTFHSLAIKRY